MPSPSPKQNQSSDVLIQAEADAEADADADAESEAEADAVFRRIDSWVSSCTAFFALADVIQPICKSGHESTRGRRCERELDDESRAPVGGIIRCDRAVQAVDDHHADRQA